MVSCCCKFKKEVSLCLFSLSLSLCVFRVFKIKKRVGKKNGAFENNNILCDTREHYYDSLLEGRSTPDDAGGGGDEDHFCDFDFDFDFDDDDERKEERRTAQKEWRCFLFCAKKGWKR